VTTELGTPVCVIASSLDRLEARRRHSLLVALTAIVLVLVATSGRGETPRMCSPEGPVAAGAARLVFRPIFDGRPLQNFDRAKVHVWLIGRSRQDPPARIWGGYVESEAVPTDVYSGGLTIEADHGAAARWPLPGDLTGEVQRVALLRDGESRTIDVPVARIIRLRDPEDTVNGVARASDVQPRLGSPVHFAWDGVPGATRYAVQIAIYRPRPGNPYAGNKLTTRRLLARDVTTTHWQVDLPPSRRGEYYEFVVTAFGRRGVLGRLFVQGDKWYGMQYRFVVDEVSHAPRAGTSLLLPPLREKHPDVGAPLREWCPYAQYVSAAACEARRQRFPSGG
jgi:hypothetical protein